MLFHIIFVEIVIMRVSSHTVGGVYLFLCGPPSAPGQLAVVVHGGSSAAR